MEERSLRVVGTDKTFFNRLTSTLTKFLIPTQIGINGIKISMKRSALIKAYEATEEDVDNKKKESVEKKYEDAYLQTVSGITCEQIIDETFNVN